jgi:hypothetical protein
MTASHGDIAKCLKWAHSQHPRKSCENSLCIVKPEFAVVLKPETRD